MKILSSANKFVSSISKLMLLISLPDFNWWLSRLSSCRENNLESLWRPLSVWAQHSNPRLSFRMLKASPKLVFLTTDNCPEAARGLQSPAVSHRHQLKVPLTPAHMSSSYLAYLINLINFIKFFRRRDPWRLPIPLLRLEISQIACHFQSLVIMQ